MAQALSSAELTDQAEERSRALLRSIVPQDEWPVGGNCIRFTAQSGKTYEILFMGTVDNIIQIYEGRRYRTWGGPYKWTEYLDLEYYQSSGLLRTNRELYNPDRIAGVARKLPIWDFYLGQYLALKYDEAAFLRKARGGYSY